MKIFEFYFNPQGNKNQYLKSFTFDWERKQEHTLGTLLVAGELANALPQNARLLDKLALSIKDSYISSGDFKFALKQANDFLGKEIKLGNVDWLGNLHVAVVVLKRKKDSTTQLFSGAKTGAIQLFLSRKGALADFQEHLGESNARQGSARAFGNVVSGKVVPEDKLLLCTPQLFETFSRQNTFQDLAYFMHEQQFQGLFKSKEKELSKNPGLLAAILVEEIVLKKVSKKTPLFSLPSFKIPVLKFPKYTFPVLSLKKPVFSKEGKSLPALLRKALQAGRIFWLIFFFLGVLLLGSLLF